MMVTPGLWGQLTVQQALIPALIVDKNLAVYGLVVSVQKENEVDLFPVLIELGSG